MHFRPRCVCGLFTRFVWADYAWVVILFVWVAWKNITGIGRGGACVPARVAPQGRIHRSIPRTQCVYFWYGNAATRTFGRAHRHRPYGFVWPDWAWVSAPTQDYSIKGAFVVHPMQGWHFHSAWKRRFSFLFVSLQAIKM